MIITIVSPYFPYPKRGQFFGTERYTENLAINLSKIGNDVKIITSFWNGGKKYDNYKGIQILRVQDSRNLFGYPGTFFFFHFITFGLNLFRKKVYNFYKDSDVLILNLSIPFSRFFKIKKIPIISIFHHYISQFSDISLSISIDKSNRMKNFIKSIIKEIRNLLNIFHLSSLYYLENQQFKKHKHIITGSIASKKDLMRYYRVDGKNIKIIPYGVETDKFNPSNYSKVIRKKYGNNILLYSGIMIKRKQIPVLLEAMIYVIKKIPDVHLILTGIGIFLNKHKNLSNSLGIQNYTTFLGFVEDNELSKYYASSDIFVFPSEKEGFGQVLLEAMASGIPVICANIPPMSNIIKNGGLTFKLNDSKDLSNKIIELLNNRDQLAKLRQNGLKIVKDYSLKHIACTYVECIKEIKNLT